MRIVHSLGRAIFGGFFLYNGIKHLTNVEGLTGYAAAKQLPSPELSVKGSGVLLTAAGAGLLLGLKPKLSALGLVGFLAATSATMHDFWNVEDAQAKQAEFIQFSKNMALLGAAIAIAGVNDEEKA